LGDSIAQLLVRMLPAPMEMVAMDDHFGESGTPDELMKKFGLDTIDIVNSVMKVLNRKNR